MARGVPAGSAPDAVGGLKQWRSLALLVGLAAGGEIGSGWFSSGANADYFAHGYEAIFAWLIGGSVMLALAAVMVELSIFSPTTGGLIFSPLQKCGPLVATIAAAAFWLAYALNSAAEAVFMAKEVCLWCHHDQEPASWVIVLATIPFMLLILMINLVPPRWFVRISLGLTIIKIIVPVLILLLFMTSASGKYFQCVSEFPDGSPNIISVMISAGIIFAYIGFQTPVDIAGNISKDGAGTASPLRGAVYGTVIGSIVLYTLLQLVFSHVVVHGCNGKSASESPYIQYASHIHWTWLVIILGIDAIASPLGSGIVYSFALTREIVALSHAGLTARVFQARRPSTRFFKKPYPIYRNVLVANFCLGFIAVLFTRQYWTDLSRANSVLNLFAYTISCIVLVAILPREGVREGRKLLLCVLAWGGFVGVALMFYWSDKGSLLAGMVELVVGCALLLGLPLLAEMDLPPLTRLMRRYDAKRHAEYLWSPGGRVALASIGLPLLVALDRLGLPGARSRLTRYRVWKGKVMDTASGARSCHAVTAGLELLAFLVALAVLNTELRVRTVAAGVLVTCAVAGFTCVMFWLIVTASRRYIEAGDDSGQRQKP